MTPRTRGPLGPAAVLAVLAVATLAASRCGYTLVGRGLPGEHQADRFPTKN
jgi:hypothetical protein